MSDNGVCSIGPSVNFKLYLTDMDLLEGQSKRKKLFISFPAMPPKPSADLPYTVTQKPFTQIGNSFQTALPLASDNWSALFLVAWQHLGSQKSPPKHKLTGLVRAKTYRNPGKFTTTRYIAHASETEATREK